MSSQPMKRFVLTGAPGSGKTALLRVLATRGYAVVEEAATDVIAERQQAGVDEPWTDHDFTERIAALQRERQLATDALGAPFTFYDRSPVCTLALARYLGHPVGPVLRDELARITDEHVYDERALFVRPLGWVEATAARRITFEDSLRFERVHEEVYAELGYQIVDVPAAAPEDRAALVERLTRTDSPSGG